MPDPKRPLKVFLCHADVDGKSVQALYERLVKDGVDAWLDKENILPGQAWDYEIRKAVRESDAVLVCLSKQFNQAGYRQKEVRLALDTAMEKPEGEIFIIPARLEECETLESLRAWNWVNLFEADGYEKLLRALKIQADKVGVTIKGKRGAKSKHAMADSAQGNANQTSASSGGVGIGGNVSGSMVVTGSGNIINLNQAQPTRTDNGKIEVVANGVGRYTTKVRLKTDNLENVFALLQNRLQAISPKQHERKKILDTYPDGVERTVTYYEILMNPNRVGNKLTMMANYVIMVYPGKTDRNAEEITEMHRMDAITFIGWETQTVLLELEYSPTWHEVVTTIVLELSGQSHLK